MTDSHSDLRVVRTRESIKHALIALIEEKGFEAITVKDITTSANINRGTFYSHYQDKYDLMTKCEEELMKEMKEKIIKKLPSILADLEKNKPDVMPLAILVPFFEFIQRNRSLMKALLGPKGDLSFQTKLKTFMGDALFKSNETIFKQENLLVPVDYLVTYIASAHIGVLQEWLKNDRAESPEEIARIIFTMTANGPFFAAGVRR
ncbi:TetR/AcrR family transcriptional regulator [Jeotgalibacillus campisalis]|uniref:TetR family transcriptional regulator n=1 Tax=Jeotgalibacillus campisalis TaxID=220754 RepID=A0A0C2VF32_9BACL|nr:TetR/AcrR family transcriptional regulator C-terminal domain-containing protein [Jeotgalibacillus campisalis]KIL43131.1 TetR family transcriptional regulator [Jeotgalibacillus campisalis]